ncbi:hypothetical protein [Paenibacillus larvae]|uniref:hypothetical protein n=1 Tax=Paenibacillus larvae TaxID=1464 RepID=UPI0013140E9A|nr:hypothetical protein [Paenibacillus larvae]
MDESYKKNVSVPDEIIHSIGSWMNLLNEDVRNGNVVIHSDLSVTYNGKQIGANLPSLSIQPIILFFGGAICCILITVIHNL